MTERDRSSELRSVSPESDNPRVVIPVYRDIRSQLRGKIVSNFWYDDLIDSGRAVFRPSHERTYGEGSSLAMPLAASWMSTGRQSTERNVVAFPEKVDRTFVEYMQRIGVLGDHVFMRSFHDFPKLSKEHGMPIYNVDDLPEEWDDVSANKARTVRTINTKKYLSDISSFAAPYEVLDVRGVTEADYERIAGPDGVVYLKKNNTENTSNGVFIARNSGEFMQVMSEIATEADAYDLDTDVVAQRKVEGTNNSFQYFINPDSADEVQLLTISKQLVEPDGKSYAGNENPPMTPNIVDADVRAVIQDSAQRIRSIDPDIYGFFMCDYFRTPDGKILTFDPGLRVSGNTPTILARMFVEEATGEHGKYSSEFFSMSEGKFFSDGAKAGTSFAEYTRPIDALMSPDSAVRDKVCVLPWGYNQYKGEGLFIAVAQSRDALKEVISDARSMIQSAQ